MIGPDHPARQRFVRLMKGMIAATLVVVALAWTYFYHELGFVSIHFYVATGLGVTFAMMLMGGLMGLVFLSNESGHDQDVSEAPDRED